MEKYFRNMSTDGLIRTYYTIAKMHSKKSFYNAISIHNPYSTVKRKHKLGEKRLKYNTQENY